MGKAQYNEERIKERINKNVLEAITEVLSKDIVTETRITVDSDKLMEYLWLRPSDTGLNVDVFVDDGGSYRRDGHRLILIARNGYSESVDEFLYFSIERFPQLLNREISINILPDDVWGIAMFIQNNLKTLQELADSKIDHRDFINSLKGGGRNAYHGKYDIAETDDISEYMWLKPERTGLNVDVFVDDGGAYIAHQHPLVILIRVNSGGDDFNTIPMTVSSNPQLLRGDNNINDCLNARECMAIRRFILNNLEMLKKLADRKITQLEFFERVQPMN